MTIIPSSQNTFLTLNNVSYKKLPYVIFTVTITDDSDVTITFTNENNSFSRTIVGSEDGEISQSSFNTSGSLVQVVFSLVECLKKNAFLYNIYVAGDNTIQAYLDTSTTYIISSSNTDFISITDGYSSYSTSNISKVVLSADSDLLGKITLEKNTIDSSVYFNLQSIYQKITFFSPDNLSLSAYSVNNNEITVYPLTYAYTVMPTTISQFDDIDYNDYYIIEGDETVLRKFLTKRETVPYNYNEIFTVSILTDYDVDSLIFRRKYYTNSGTYITTIDGADYYEQNDIRIDYYSDLYIADVEEDFGVDVGYVEITVVNISDITLTETLTCKVKAKKCDTNRQLFYLNTLGGVDEWNFLYSMEENTAIDDKLVYSKLLTEAPTDVYEIQEVGSKIIETEITYSTRITSDELVYLIDLQRSKYVYKFEDNAKHIVIVDEFDIENDYSSKYSVLEVTFYNSEDNLIY